MRGSGIHLPIYLSLLVIAGVATVSIVFSLGATSGGEKSEEGDVEETREPS